jgi:hypothetical protein
VAVVLAQSMLTDRLQRVLAHIIEHQARNHSSRMTGKSFSSVHEIG